MDWGPDLSEHALRRASELTIATGAVTATRSYHTIDTEGDVASDDLDTISGLGDGELLLIRPESAARTIVLRHQRPETSGVQVHAICRWQKPQTGRCSWQMAPTWW